jgi:hypothetical protein
MRRLLCTTTLLAGLAVVPLVLGCGSSAPKNDAPDAPAASVNDTTTNRAAVYAKSRLEGDRLIVDVIARGAADIHGAAFRMHWDTAKLSFLEAAESDAWSRQALHLAKEGAPGELVVAWTEKGSGAAIDGREDTRLGTITFTSKNSGTPESPPQAMFRSDRSMLLDSRGARIDVAWRDKPAGD